MLTTAHPGPDAGECQIFDPEPTAPCGEHHERVRITLARPRPWERRLRPFSGERHGRGPRRGLDDVEFATLGYIDWFNHRRLHGEIADDNTYVTPAEFEAAYYRQEEAVALSRSPKSPSSHETQGGSKRGFLGPAQPGRAG
jgi:hypothetical protein